VYITGSAVNGSEVTGILYGATPPANVNYPDRKTCDSSPNWANDPNIFLPRSIRTENNTFANNDTGVVAGTARWVGVRNNMFTNNYINPPVDGDQTGGNIFMDQCADTVQIFSNQMYGPTYLHTLGPELWGRNIDVENNNPISGYAGEGIMLNSTYMATVKDNYTVNNGRASTTGGILAWSPGPGGACNQIPRDLQTATISGNISTGQAYGLRFGDRDSDNRNVMNNVTVTSDNTFVPNSVAALALDSLFVTLPGYLGPSPTLTPGSPVSPRALAIDAVSPVSSKCSTPGRDRETFTFPAADVSGANNVASIEVIFRIQGNDDTGSGGPTNYGEVCHLLYIPSANVVYLDDTSAGYTWSGGSSVVGAGGSYLGTNNPVPYCTIHAGSGSSNVQTEPYNVDLTLDIEFGPSSWTSSKKHMYVVTTYPANLCPFL
jgi:hypothetical protein